MTDELDWYQSYSGPRATVTTVPDLGSVARAVALWAYDPDRPRGASKEIAEMTRRDVAFAMDAALRGNPLLLSPKKRERQLALPAAADARLVAVARKRIRKLYPEIEHAERAAKLPVFEQEHPAARKILDGYYPGSGGGRPRVPENYPLMLAQVESGLLDVASAVRDSSRAGVEHLSEDSLDCLHLCRAVSATCKALRRQGQDLCRELRASAAGDPPDRMAGYRAERIEASLAEGNLPYANSEILPVGPYGMHPKWGLEPPVSQFAEDSQDAYEEIDRYGRLAMNWARRVALRARDMLPPHMPDADTDSSHAPGGAPAIGS